MLALALGVCANTTIFSLVNGMLIRPLSGVKDCGPEAIYTSDFSSGLYGGWSDPDFLDFRAQTDTLETSLLTVDQSHSLRRELCEA